MMYVGQLLGRTKIYTDESVITSENIIDVLKKAYGKHKDNMRQMKYLIDYERGIQPLKREKTIRPDIDIRVNSNTANYIKEFKVSYNWSNPIMLVQRGDNELHKSDSKKDDDGITALNEMLRNAENIVSKDQRMAEYLEICGIGHKMVDIRTKFDKSHKDDLGSLVHVYAMDSMNTFCVYYNGVGEEKVLGVTFRKAGNTLRMTAFTDDTRYEIKSWKIESETHNLLGMIPIIEFERAIDRTGSFERQISQMDSLNIMISDFTNDVAQQTQNIYWGNDIDFPKDEKTGLPMKPQSGQWLLTYTGENGNNPKVVALSSTLNGSSTLQSISSTRNRILQEAKVPIQYETSGSGNTGTATDMSSGWSNAELDALREQQLTESSKREELELIIRAIQFVPNDVLPANHPIRSIHSSDVDFHFNRRKNYDMAIKANTFATLVSHGVHGRAALKVIDMFDDTEQVWVDSKDMIEAYQESQCKPQENESDRLMSDTSDNITQSPILDGMTRTDGTNADNQNNKSGGDE